MGNIGPIPYFQKAVPVFAQGPGYEEVVEATPRKLSINVIRCKYAEMYRKRGPEDIGYLFSCARDYTLMEGFNPRIRFVWAPTVVEGAPFCDIRCSV